MAVVIRFDRLPPAGYDRRSAPIASETSMPAVAPESNAITEPRETLEQLQRRLIAELLKVPVETVTDEYIDELMEKHVYPDGRFDINSEYGGYDNSHLTVLTRNEFDALEERVARARRQLREEAARAR